jgi:hypothetical protein
MTSTVSKAELICPHCQQLLHVSVQLPPAFRDDAVTELADLLEGLLGAMPPAQLKKWPMLVSSARAAVLKSRAG